MSQHQNGNGFLIPYVGIPFPPDLEVCWAGEAPEPEHFCFGSISGIIQIVSSDLTEFKGGPIQASPSEEAINGVARLGAWVAVSTRRELSFWSTTKDQGGGAVPHGSQGVATTRSGYFIGPFGKEGILVARPPFTGETDVVGYATGSEDVYVYRVISLPLPDGSEALVCAARLSGVVYGMFCRDQEEHVMSRAKFGSMDIIDVCSLPGTLAVIALARDGTLILFQSILSDKKPKEARFASIKGVAYRVLSHRGDVYVLTSEGLYVLGNLGAEVVQGTAGKRSTPILPIAMEPVDMSLAWDRWILVVTQNEVRRFDGDLIHAHVPEDGDGMPREQPDIQDSEPEWSDSSSTSSMMMASAR